MYIEGLVFLKPSDLRSMSIFQNFLDKLQFHLESFIILFGINFEIISKSFALSKVYHYAETARKTD